MSNPIETIILAKFGEARQEVDEDEADAFSGGYWRGIKDFMEVLRGMSPDIHDTALQEHILRTKH